MKNKKIYRLLITLLFVFPAALRAYDKPLSVKEYEFASELFRSDNFTLAEKLYKIFIIENAGNPMAGDAAFMEAEILFVSGRYREALSAYSGITEKYPSKKNKYRKEIFFRMAECYFNLGDYETSEKYTAIILKDYPGSLFVRDAYLLMGENKFLLGKYDEAVSYLNLLEKFTDYTHFDYVYYLLGRIYYEKMFEPGADKKENSAMSIKYFRRVSSEFPDSPVINHSEFRKANVYYALKQYKTAVKIIKNVMTKEKNEKFLLLMRYFLAWNYFQLKEYEKASGEYDVIISKFGSDMIAIWSMYKKGLCLQAEAREKEAVYQFEEVIKNYDATIPAAYSKYAIAGLYYQKKEYYESLRRFESIADEYNNLEELNRAALFMSADIYVALGKFTKARNVYEKIEKEYPEDTYTAAYMQAWCLSKEGKYTESNDIYVQIFTDERAPGVLRAKSLLKTGDNYYEKEEFDEALSYYNRVIKEYYGFKELAAEVDYAKGWILYRKSDYAGAEKYFKRITDSGVNYELYARARFMLANTLYADFKIDDALKIYLDIMNDKRAPGIMRNESVFYAAWCYYRNKKFQIAVDFWEKFAADSKSAVKKAEAYFRIGWAFFRQNEFGRAAEKFGVIIENFKSTHFYQEALLKTGDCHYNSGEYEKAVIYYRRLVDSFPEHYRIGEALYGIQWSYYRLGESEKAIKLSKEFVNKFPDSAFTPEIQYRVAEHYYNEGKFDTAVSEFRSFIDKYPEHSLADNAYYWMGTGYFNLRKYNEAIRSFRELNDKFAENPFRDRAVFRIANSYYRLNQYQNALDVYTVFINDFPDSEYADNAYFNSAMSYKRLGRIEDAKRRYIEFLEKFSGSELAERAHMNLAYLYQDNREYDEAIAVFEKVIELKGKKSVEAQFWIADCYYAKKELTKAAAEYMKIYDNYRGDEMWAVSALDSAARIYEKQGKLKKAINAYKKVSVVTKKKKYTQTAEKKIELLEEQYRLLNPAPSAGTPAKKPGNEGGAR